MLYYVQARQEIKLDINEAYEVARSGDEAATERLYGHLLEGFRAVVQHHIWNDADGEEIVQEALVTVISKFRETEIESSFAGWAHQVLRNKIRDYVKLKAIRARRMDEYKRNQTRPRTMPDDPELKARIKKCFEKVHRANRNHARVLNLHHQGFSTDEICAKLGMTPNGFYIMLMRARTALAKCLRNEESER